MLILFGKKILDSKKICYALTDLFGIGHSNVKKICLQLNFPTTLKIADLTEIQKLNLAVYIKQNFTVEAKLKKTIYQNIETFMAINSVKGFRHRMKLPVRGQRTHSNAQTCKNVSQFFEFKK